MTQIKSTEAPVAARPPEPPPSRALPPLIAAALVFGASFAVLVLEIMGLRLLAPYIGLTLQTNSAVIGAALAAIALGAWLGGRLADVVDPRALLGPVLLFAGVATLLILPTVRWIGGLVQGGDRWSVILLAAVAVVIPASLLSMVTPLVVKLELRDLHRTGSIVGRLSGIGTVGAVAATFLTGFVFVAAMPSSTIVISTGAIACLVGVVLILPLRRRHRPAVLATGVVAALVAGGLVIGAPEPCQVETGYHCANVLNDPQRPTGRMLKLDTAEHSYVDLVDPTYLGMGYVEAISSVTGAIGDADTPLRVLHLGGGGMTMPAYLAATRPASDNLVIEVDGGIVDLDRREFGFREGPRVRVEVQDARMAVARHRPDDRDIVIGDAFGYFAVPWHLTTREFVTDIHRVLRQDGVYILNLIDFAPADLARAQLATLRKVFGHVAVISSDDALNRRGGGNFVIVASDRELPLNAITERLGSTKMAGYLRVADEAETARLATGGRILTDDYAPVDQLITVPFEYW